ncbi:IclR family transcriptional regulator [Roseibacterium sp. SDUM158017]|uniref:IclR family transcriptional regulator n=1 Tax=Roseicyclus salinarum TaxID=3036773 RepID=UPI0024152925|nr:IclR family transcriptional regulator [Roseibacterium sp. SDUM158017]MDG4647873.1 IclR family transcriptional regulator [Roseibacterium sp. SDUM158017]
MTDEASEDRRDGRIQSLERAFSVLEEVARHRSGITLSELSRELGLHTSTLYHVTRTLVSLGYLRTGPDDKRYRIGRGIFQLASACLDEAEICATATPYLEKLAEATGEASHYAIWERRKALILVRHAGPNALQINERAGTLRPVYCTAIGKALLSGLEPDAYDEYTRDVDFAPYTPSTLKDAQELRLQVEKARRDGIAFDDCEFNAEVRCMAATVRDFSGKVVGAIGFSGPVWRMSLTDMAEYTSITRSIAAELSEQFGFRTEEVASDATSTTKARSKSHGKA